MKPKTALSKGEKTKLKLLEGALIVLGEHGEADLSFQKIADACGVSQPLVVHYFKTRENIFREVVHYFLDIALPGTEEALKVAPGPKEELINYFRFSLEFVRSRPGIGRTYALLYYLGAYDEEYARICARWRREAVERITGILLRGIEKGIFKTDNPEAMAKVIHNNLNGLILGAISEKPAAYTDNQLLSQLNLFCLLALGAK